MASDALKNQPQPISTAPLDGSDVLVYFPLERGPLAVTPAHFMDGTWWARGLDLPDPLYWLPLTALPDWPPDPSLSDDLPDSFEGLE